MILDALPLGVIAAFDVPDRIEVEGLLRHLVVHLVIPEVEPSSCAVLAVPARHRQHDPLALLAVDLLLLAAGALCKQVEQPLAVRYEVGVHQAAGTGIGRNPRVEGAVRSEVVLARLDEAVGRRVRHLHDRQHAAPAHNTHNARGKRPLAEGMATAPVIRERAPQELGSLSFPHQRGWVGRARSRMEGGTRVALALYDCRKRLVVGRRGHRRRSDGRRRGCDRRDDSVRHRGCNRRRGRRGSGLAAGGGLIC
mmetsp:Transcript_33613/g.112202  ORF Transcript_33613/g.112202 Transcript_33613/m.112202 type:complete len:252 (-) Transcript_33613:5-760(-)